MNTSALLLAGALAAAAPWSASAAPDWHGIEQARKAKQAQQAQERAQEDASAPEREGTDPALPELRPHAQPAAASRAEGSAPKCPPQPLVLPLDHGFRAVTTPDQNRLLRERYAAEVKACPHPGK